MCEQEGLPESEIQDVLKKFDADGDGSIQWVEFKVAIMSSDIWTKPLSNAEMVYLTFDDPRLQHAKASSHELTIHSHSTSHSLVHCAARRVWLNSLLQLFSGRSWLR